MATDPTAAAHVQVPPDSTGSMIDQQAVTSAESGSPTVLRQTITLGDPSTYGNVAAVDAHGNLYVRAEALFGAFAEMSRELTTIRMMLGSIGDINLTPEDVT